MPRNSNNNRNNSTNDRNQLVIPKYVEFYDEVNNTPTNSIKTKEREFFAIKNPKGWWIYSHDTAYAQAPCTVEKDNNPNQRFKLDDKGLMKIINDKRYRMVKEVFIGDKLIQGSNPVEIEHNRVFLGLDWTKEKEQAIIFLRYL